MENYNALTLSRVDNFVSKLRDSVFPAISAAGVKLYFFSPPFRIVPGETQEPYKFEDVVGKYEFEPCFIGKEFGPAWSQHWIKVLLEIPTDWTGQEVCFRFNAECEGLVFSEHGEPLQGLLGTDGDDKRLEFPVTRSAGSAADVTLFYIQLSCNSMFGNGTPPDPKTFTLRTAQLVIFDRLAWDLLWDFVTVVEMAKNLPQDGQRAAQALFLANKVANTYRPSDRSSWTTCRALMEPFFAQRNGQSQHLVSAIGHCHIDTAWLWRFAETRRKSARSWSSQLALMDYYKDFKFTVSQAQQLEWLKDGYPTLFKRIQQAASEKRFIVTGGTWVEMDCNLPCGESLVRQFLLGQRFFRENFGHTCSVFWLPDSFGYSSQLPQITKQAGISYFLTQKLSWNDTNKFPHNTFLWEGLDGSRVLAHFPPADTYNSGASVRELLFGVTNYKDKVRGNESLLLFGFGDGGGGPRADHVERLIRARDVDGLPLVTFRCPEEFFDRLQKNTQDPLVWAGELYFELHRGTYTTQAHTKRNNRKSEVLMHNTELILSLNFALSTTAQRVYPHEELTAAWKTLCLQQFHDVLPGSSIGLVYADSAAQFAALQSSATALLTSALANLLPEQQPPSAAKPEGGSGPAGPSESESESRPTPVREAADEGEAVYFVNTLGWARQEVVAVPAEMASALDTVDVGLFPVQPAYDGSTLVVAQVPSMGFSKYPTTSVKVHTECSELTGGDWTAMDSQRALTPSQDPLDFIAASLAMQSDGSVVLENQFLRARINCNGQVTSLVLKAEDGSGRETLPVSLRGNVFVLFDDDPLYWDAWEVMAYHLETRKELGTGAPDEKLGTIRPIENGPLRVAVQVAHTISAKSSIQQTISLDALSSTLVFTTSVEWHEGHRFLKVEFPAAVRAFTATYETQFGFVQRPTIFNTSWDLAKFEVCGHKWADVSEFGFGVALLNDCKYGHAIHSTKDYNVMRLSLLRSPKSPDDEADMGLHNLTYAIHPHLGSFQSAGVVSRAHELNVPLLLHRVKTPLPSLPVSVSYFKVLGDFVQLDTVKKAEDSDALILRLYERYGCRGPVTIKTLLPIKSAVLCNLLEEDGQRLQVSSGSVTLTVSPFEIVSLKCHV